jgi:hypothetical protein
MIPRTFVFSIVFIAFYSNQVYACSGGTNSGSLIPSAVYQTQAVSNGQYYVVNVTCGFVYNFTFCSNGGTAGWDTQITINQTDDLTQLAYNDDACGLQSNLTWTANFTGTVHVLISRYNCFHDGTLNGTMAYAVSPPVSYSPGCTAATTSISGISSPSFVFSPAPSDGATINTATGAISNATPGATYQVLCTHSCGSLNLSVTMSTAPCFLLSGSSSVFNSGGEDCIQLTQEINNQTGCAWNEEVVDFNSSFTLSVDYYFGNNINGADGTTFTFQPNPNSPCGQNGGQLGAGGIPNALVVEFDTYDNDNPAHIYDMACDHIAIETDGNLLGPGAPFCGPICAKPLGGNIDDGGTYEVEIIWDAVSQTLQVFFDGVLRLSCSADFVNSVFGGQNTVNWGITSATGGLNNQQYFCPSTVVVLPTEMISFSSSCDGQDELIAWQTASEYRMDHYELEYTINGQIFYPVASVEAAGNTGTLTEYAYTVKNGSQIQRYYRIKSVDQDGSFTNSDLIAAKKCSTTGMLTSYAFANGSLELFTTEGKFECNLITLAGQELLQKAIEGSSNRIEINSLLSQGVYLLTIQNIQTGEIETHRVFNQKH